jgi:MoaA/NifB/PqqE/SkfB family radical SAM enzyme
LPYVSQIKYVSLWELGEPLLDKGLFWKIKYLKKHNFKNVAIATNADLLDEKKQMGLLEAGIDTIICSIDGTDKKTHESIRINTNFERVVKNVQSCIEKRNKGNYKTRFLIRMIRQKLNYKQWPKYIKYWEKYIDRTKRDDIIAFDVHDWGGTRCKEKNIDWSIPCLDLNERMIIDFDGEVTLCCGEIAGKKELGNVLLEDPIAIFNNEIFRYYREMNLKGLRKYLYPCRECNIPDQRKRRILTTAPAKISSI